MTASMCSAQGLEKLVAELLSDEYPVVAAYECWERLYHFQSFCIGLSGAVLYDRASKSFGSNTGRSRFDDGASIMARSACRRRCEKCLRVSRWFTASTSFSTLLTAGDDWASILKYREFVPGPCVTYFLRTIFCRCCSRPSPRERETSASTAEGGPIGPPDAQSAVSYRRLLFSQVPRARLF